MKSLLALVALLPVIGRAAEPSLTDKTLVVWAAPANLEQRGGSVLTIDDQHGHGSAGLGSHRLAAPASAA